jgi:ActR/RegA family two-component response regulator
MTKPSTNSLARIAAHDGPEARIVLVAPDGAFEAALAHVLEDAGFAVWSVATLREALACIAELPPEHVIVDLDGVESDGLGSLRELANASPEANVVVCTCDPSLARLDAIARSRLGIDAIVRRPCRLEAIVNTIRALGEAARKVVYIPLRAAVISRAPSRAGAASL